jgi:hypothetical protein
VNLAKAEAEKRDGQADAVARGDELLGEEDDPDGAEQVQRPRDRPCDEQGGKRALR